MNYLQTHNRNAFSQRRGLWGSVAAFVIIIIFVQFLEPHFLPAIFTTFARPFWRAEFSISSGSLRSPASLLNQNEELKRQLADMTVRLETTQSVANENSELKTLLNRPSATATNANTATSSAAAALLSLVPSKYTLAAVLKRPPMAPYDELIIDLGQDDGVAVNDLVYAPGNILIGSISDTLGQTSKVALFSSSGMTYDVLIANNSNPGNNSADLKPALFKSVPAVAHGLGGGQFSVQVPRDIVVNVGDIVTVPSINNKTIGIVGGVITDPAQPFETVLFTSLANIYELRWALVDTKTDSVINVANIPSRTSAAIAPVTKNAKK